MESKIIDLKGNIVSLDPKSKILTTYLLILGVAISIDFFQIFLYLLISIPLLIFYKPRREFLSRAIISSPIIVIFCGILYLSLQTPSVTISVFGYSRPYTKIAFIGLIAYRYFIILLYNYMLLFSEDSPTDIIEALASFKLGTAFVTILLLIKRLSIRVKDDYNKMLYAASSKGALSTSLWRRFYIRLIILGRLLVRSVQYGDNITQTLMARGFYDHFQPTTRSWTSEGVTIFLLAVVLFVDITLIPWMRG